MPRILVVEDEPDVADLLVEILQAEGYTVDRAANGAEALERLNWWAYDAIVTDARMPLMDGPTLYRELEQRHPELRLRVAFITGNVLGAETQEFLARTAVPTLEKPIDFEAVRRVVRQLLGK